MTKEIIEELEEKLYKVNTEILNCQDNKITSEEVKFQIIRLQDIVIKSSALLSQIKVSNIMNENDVNDSDFKKMCIEEIIDSKLEYYGLRRRLNGFRLLKAAILVIQQDEKNMNGIKSQISTDIAKKEGLKRQTVYSTLIRSIEDAWKKNGNIVKRFKSIPTTKEFITLIIEEIKKIEIYPNTVTDLILKLRENLSNANNYIERINGNVYLKYFNWKDINKFLKEAIQTLNESLEIKEINFEVVDNISIEDRISIELKLLGMKEYFQGYKYAKEIVLRVINKEDELINVRKNLYANVANKFGVGREAAERKVRDDITYMWLQNYEITKKFYTIPKMKNFVEYIVEKIEKS